MKLLGAILIVAAGAAMGLSKYLALKKRADTLDGLLSALGQMRGEISLRLTPLGELMRLLAEQGSGAAHGFFLKLSAGMENLDERGFSAVWDAALPELAVLSSDDLAAMAALGASLGRFDVAEQCAAINAAAARLEISAARAREALPAAGKLYIGLGLGVAAMLAVALL